MQALSSGDTGEAPNSGEGAVSDKDFVTLLYVADFRCNFLSIFHNLDSRCLSETASTAITTFLFDIIVGVGCYWRLVDGLRLVLGLSFAVLTLVRCRPGDLKFQEGLVAFNSELLEEWSTVHAQTSVHEVCLHHNLMRSEDTPEVVLAPSVEPCSPIESLDHPAVHITGKLDNRFIIRDKFRHLFNLLANVHHLGHGLRILADFHIHETLIADGDGAAAERSNDSILIGFACSSFDSSFMLDSILREFDERFHEGLVATRNLHGHNDLTSLSPLKRSEIDLASPLFFSAGVVAKDLPLEFGSSKRYELEGGFLRVGAHDVSATAHKVCSEDGGIGDEAVSSISFNCKIEQEFRIELITESKRVNLE